MKKVIHIHIGTKDSATADETVQPNNVAEAIRKAEAVLSRLKSQSILKMDKGDFKEGYRALTLAYNWFS